MRCMRFTVGAIREILPRVDGRAAAERDLDLAAGHDAAEMQFVDVGQDAQLAHVDDLDDAIAATSRSAWRV